MQSFYWGGSPASSGAMMRGRIDGDRGNGYAVPGRPYPKPTMTDDIHNGEG
jgi:hypothetical protein